MEISRKKDRKHSSIQAGIRRPARGPDALDFAQVAIAKQCACRLFAQAHEPAASIPDRNPSKIASHSPAFKGQGHVAKARRCGRHPDRPRRSGGGGDRADGSHNMIRLSYTSNTLATNTAEGYGQGRPERRRRRTLTQLVASQSSSFRSRSTTSGPMRCQAAAWDSSSTVRRRTPTSRSTRSASPRKKATPIASRMASQTDIISSQHRPDYGEQRPDRRHRGFPGCSSSRGLSVVNGTAAINRIASI